ncbi:PTS fructose transporter subunit IID [Lactobacillus sp. CBA3605]|uniref:PTS system mannose/fructose/sorbose family transporter subunit IID n=1 Tax=Lactobacillus sp. CBA3605 TaxID=2099788 RepID=UPI000CFC1F38|nr:PTS system mannose/fructose/sorbose family transporter subunit IID [Lactobacillus sp. CBA3605]AVK61487.1 PTS fructose transporter subunit IID [Lactobacillus sp. CBA3605]
MSNKVELSKTNKKTFWRWYFFGQAGWNYEKMQGLGYYYSVYPLIKQIYGKTDIAAEAAINELQFFNTNNSMAPIILGVDSAIQEKQGIAAKDTVAGLKTGMMGPFAGIGDTLFAVIPNTIIGSIASYMALKGNPVGLILWIAYGFLRLGIMRSFFGMGYREGIKLIDSLGNRLKKITSAANILGLTVIGALIPSVITAVFAYKYKQGGVKISLQDMADQIMPGLAPALVVLLAYWLLGRKKMNSTRVTLILIVVGVLAYNLKIFA